MRQLLVRPSQTVGGAELGQQHDTQSAEEELAGLMLLLDIEQRVANWTAMPPNHLEGWEVSRRGFGLRWWHTAAAAHACCMLLVWR
jgi:hypothetical protein